MYIYKYIYTRLVLETIVRRGHGSSDGGAYRGLLAVRIKIAFERKKERKKNVFVKKAFRSRFIRAVPARTLPRAQPYRVRLHDTPRVHGSAANVRSARAQTFYGTKAFSALPRNRQQRGRDERDAHLADVP